MKQTLAVVVVVLVVAAVGFAGFWIGRSGAPPAPTRHQGAVAPALAQSASSVTDPAALSTAPALKKAARSIRTQVFNSSSPSTQVMQKMDAATKDRTRTSPTATAANTNTDALMKTPQELLSRFTDDDPSQVFQPDTVRYHEAVQAEPVDPEWGPEAQADLQAFFSAEFAQNDAYVAAECGTDLCELDIVADANDSPPFYKALRVMKQQPWWTALQFDQESGAVSFDKGRTVIAYFFSRK
jgi:hypothetical protein